MRDEREVGEEVWKEVREERERKEVRVRGGLQGLQGLVGVLLGAGRLEE